MGAPGDVDRCRLQGLKSILTSYATARKAILEKALHNTALLCEAAEALDPEADCAQWLQSADLGDLAVAAPQDNASVNTSQVSAAAGGAVDFSAEGGGGDSGTAAGESAGPGQSLGVWIPDEAVRKCGKCAAAFTLLRRKHHCRKCGGVFCGKCSRNRMALPDLGYDAAVRVCDGCSGVRN